jgi:DNA transformation protein
MFSGHGLFVDAQSRPQFEASGLPPFTCTRQVRVVALCFHRAPDSAFDEPDQALHWGRLALAAAARAQAGKPLKPGSRPKASK